MNSMKNVGEISPLKALEAFPGSYECHISVDLSNDKLQEFKDYSHSKNLKFIVIELSDGLTPVQPMVNFPLHKSPQKSWEFIEEIINEMKALDFNIVRLKLEAGLQNENIPQTNDEAVNLTSMQYFEFHSQIKIPVSYDLKSLRISVKDYDGHLSRNAYKMESDFNFYFITQRFYKIGKLEALQKLEKLQEFIGSLGLSVTKSIKEFNIYDSNIELDSGWMS